MVGEARQLEGANWPTLPKEHFPRLLRITMERIEPRNGVILKSAFRTCGIYPCDVEPLLKKLGDAAAREFSEVSAGISKVLKDYIEEKTEKLREAKEEAKKKKKERRQMINWEYGKSITAEDLAAYDVEQAKKAAEEAEKVFSILSI